MKSLPTSILLVATAITQALGLYRYSDDSIAVSGQIFFPILFALTSIYLAWRTLEEGKYSTAHLVILGAAIILLVLTLMGSVGRLYYFYPSIWVYLGAFVLLTLELGLRIAATPKKKSKDKPARAKKKRRAPRGENLVATAKNSTSHSESAQVGQRNQSSEPQKDQPTTSSQEEQA